MAFFFAHGLSFNERSAGELQEALELFEFIPTRIYRYSVLVDTDAIVPHLITNSAAFSIATL